jgi:tRNA uridine 5-carboxymethylaminomethyl modification enzyme
MFTSRAEHRLLFNHGSAELRLRHHARECKLLPDSRLNRVEAKASAVLHWANFLEANKTHGGTWGDVIRRSPTLPTLPPEFLQQWAAIQEETLYRIRYRGYLEREGRQIEKLKEVEKIRLPDSIDYLKIPGLRRESALKLNQLRPVNLGQASRISGVNPADFSILMVAVAAQRR